MVWLARCISQSKTFSWSQSTFNNLIWSTIQKLISRNSYQKINSESKILQFSNCFPLAGEVDRLSGISNGDETFPDHCVPYYFGSLIIGLWLTNDVPDAGMDDGNLLDENIITIIRNVINSINLVRAKSDDFHKRKENFVKSSWQWNALKNTTFDLGIYP